MKSRESEFNVELGQRAILPGQFQGWGNVNTTNLQGAAPDSGRLVLRDVRCTSLYAPPATLVFSLRAIFLEKAAVVNSLDIANAIGHPNFQS